ncbi:MAG: cobalt transporter CbiM [Thermodesulfobacteriota bacterium]|nr:cobalt transporter CbiM [Thermodesulfobacteriota bacterium]
MHISEGVLSWQVLTAGGAVAAAGTTIGLKTLDYEKIPQTGMLSAAFFVASLVHIPIGPSNVHLILNGLVGLLLGWSAVPAILVALLLQAVMFQFGGITTLGVNTVIMAVPAVVCYYLFRPFVNRSRNVIFFAAMACGALAVFMGTLLAAAALMFTEARFLEVSALLITAHLAVMVIEGIVTGFAVVFLKTVKPVLFEK